MSCKPLTRRQQLAKFDRLIRRSAKPRAERFQEEARADRRHARVLQRAAGANDRKATLARVADYYAANRDEFEKYGTTLAELQRTAIRFGEAAVLPRKDRAITFSERDIIEAKRRAAAGRKAQ